ncbi:hypothetical protein [Gilvimarinus sp. DA14]|uniref:hypothetical protein n=1 Tax=Gilvimarinus sp. DA14 TaxID=2956798 RepID=UPI0020B6A0E5|nr:hypothetical protein [Gilvimarinus sp. DA14]UTF59545.1 hypothetical protein NHM04_13840 [Gilvimarinus sp. DA14]
MFAFIQKYLRLLKPKKPPPIGAGELEALQKDAGVRVTRIRLPSGREVVLVHRDENNDSL